MKGNWRASVLTGLVTCLLVTESTPGSGADRVHVERSTAGMVVSDSSAASRVGRDVLRDGGNAVDAAVATAFALAVTWPEAGNIGGGGFMLIRPADGKNPVCVDYRETAPGIVTPTTFTRSDTTYTQKAVGVPGTVRGLLKAHRRYGRLPWKRLVDPAISLARQGFGVDAFLAGSTNYILSLDSVRTREKYAELRRVYGKPDGSKWKSGDRMFLPDLADTLQRISRQPQDFYNGRIAEQLVSEMQRGDGMIAAADLDSYQAIVRPAIRGTFRGYTILGAPPPSSGGICIVEALNILENFDLRAYGRYSPRTIHLLGEASRRSFADRARHLADPQFTRIPDALTTKTYARQLAQGIDLRRATPSQDVAPEIKLTAESPNTTHFSIVDSDGMAVSNTYTLEASWGSRIVVRGAGFLLNNEMGDFNWFPGVTTRAGRIGTKPNQLAPGKRMLSSQSPSMVERDGKLVLVTGSPGGRTIINTSLAIILNVTEFGMNAADAVEAPRFHHQWFPDQLTLEDRDDEPHRTAVPVLRSMGHVVGTRPSQGSAHTIRVEVNGRRTGVADYRRGGRPAGYSSPQMTVFDFSDPAGTPLHKSARSGPLLTEWRGVAELRVDGRDRLLIGQPQPTDDSINSRPAVSSEAVLPLDFFSEQDFVSLTVKLDELTFAGQAPTERVRFSLTHDVAKPLVTAGLVISRSEMGIILHGEASAGGSQTAPVQICKGTSLPSPLLLRLICDTKSRTYRVLSRFTAGTDFRLHGTGRMADDHVCRFLRLSTDGDFSAVGDCMAVDQLMIE